MVQQKCKYCNTELKSGDDCTWNTVEDEYYCEKCVYSITLDDNDEDDETE
jgi:hypothetical protein